MSQITTHILNTTLGQPAQNVSIILYKGANDEWTEISRGKTNNDGRLATLLTQHETMPAGIYKLHFETKEYFDLLQVKTFYPFIEVVFEVTGTEHYHVPLLLNAYGYSTYRGS